MRYATLLAWLAGAALFAFLLFSHVGHVLQAVAALGWWIIAISGLHLAPLILDTLAWRRLFAEPPGFASLLAMRWIAESVNGLFPVPHLGEVLRADLARRMNRLGEAGASVVVDVTLALATLIPFIALGLGLYFLLSQSGRGSALRIAAAGLVLAAAIVLLARFKGLLTWAATFLARPFRPLPPAWTERLRALEAQIWAVYDRRADLAVSALWRFAGWVAGAAEMWLALFALGHPVGIAEAIILESLGQAARLAAFAIPGGLGVQDGALLLLCGQLGIGADTALALAVVRRCREAMLGLPGLAAGYLIQARLAASRRGRA